MKKYIKYILAISIASIIIILVFDIYHGLGIEPKARLNAWWQCQKIINSLWKLTMISGLSALNLIIWMCVIKFYQILKRLEG